MVVDERSRQHLYRQLENVLGPEAATTLIEYLPPVGWADVATRHDLGGLEERMELRFAGVENGFAASRKDLAGLEERMDQRFSAVDHSISAAASDLRATLDHELRLVSTSLERELRSQSNTFSQELRSQSNAFSHELRSMVTTTVFGLVSVVLTMAALAFALVRFT